MKNSVLSLLIGLVCLSPAHGQTKNDKPVDDPTATISNAGTTIIDEFPVADLPPLRRIVFYDSGVGHMQHEGELEGNARLEIRFSGHDVDDVLKSLIFEDRGGGIVKAVEYQPAPEPEDIAANAIGQPMTLAQLLQHFRGEPLTVEIDSSEVKGTIYGVENRLRGEFTMETLVLLSDGGLRSIDLQEIDRVEITNPKVQEDLNLAMRGLVKSRKANQKKLDLLFEGEGKREVRFAYVVDCPIWRMTYRLAAQDEKVLLQGWAHVDNVTGVDWEQVELELRSGRPHAFHANVFAPLMAERADVGNSVFDLAQGLTLVTQWFGFDPPERFGDRNRGGSSGGFGGGGFGGAFGGGGFSGGFGGRPTRGEAAGVDIASAFQEAATQGRSARMIRYQISDPVDIGAGKSAAIPVVSKELPAALISVFSDENESGSALRAVEITNETGLPLVAGPIAVLRDGDFVGDGALARVDVNKEVQIVYGVDRPLTVQKRSTAAKKKLTRVAVDEERVVLHYVMRQFDVFQVRNKDVEGRTLMLKYKMPDSRLTTIVSQAPDKIEDGVGTFRLDVDALQETEFRIELATEEKNPQSLQVVDTAQIREWIKQGAEIQDADMQLFESIAAVQAEVAATKKQIDDLQATKAKLIEEQARVRQNLEVLQNNPDAAKPFFEQMASVEERIQQTEADISTAELTLQTRMQRRNEIIRDGK